MEVGGSRLTSMEISMEVGGSLEASMEINGSFYGRWKWKLPLPINLLPRVSQAFSYFQKTSMGVSFNFFLANLLLPTPCKKKFPWKSVEVNSLASMEISIEVGGSRLIYFHGSSWKLPWKYMEVSTVGGIGSFDCFHQLQLPRIYSVEASMSFHVPPHTSTYFHEYHKLPAASTRLTLTLTRTLSWSCLHASCPTSFQRK